MGRAGEWERGLEVFGDMKREGINGDRTVYNAVLGVLQRGDQPKLVTEVWEEMMGRKGGGGGVVEAGVDRVSGGWSETTARVKRRQKQQTAPLT